MFDFEGLFEFLYLFFPCLCFFFGLMLVAFVTTHLFQFRFVHPALYIYSYVTVLQLGFSLSVGSGARCRRLRHAGVLRRMLSRLNNVAILAPELVDHFGVLTD